CSSDLAAETHGAGNPRRRRILIEIVVRQNRRHDLVNAYGFQERYVVGGQAVRLAEASVAGRRRMGEHRAFGFLHPHWPEFHAASPFDRRSPDMPRERNARTTCASTATAISAGLAAPMSRPIGAAMRSISSGFAPRASRRSTRLACVFRLPSAPM